MITKQLRGGMSLQQRTITHQPSKQMKTRTITLTITVKLLITQNSRYFCLQYKKPVFSPKFRKQQPLKTTIIFLFIYLFNPKLLSLYQYKSNNLKYRKRDMIETVGYDLCFSSQLKSDKISKQIYQINMKSSNND